MFVGYRFVEAGGGFCLCLFLEVSGQVEANASWVSDIKVWCGLLPQVGVNGAEDIGPPLSSAPT
jgi:hypothetical protein